MAVEATAEGEVAESFILLLKQLSPQSGKKTRPQEIGDQIAQLYISRLAGQITGIIRP